LPRIEQGARRNNTQGSRSRVYPGDSNGRIFYRNAINPGLSVLVCPGISIIVNKGGDVPAVDVVSGLVINETTGASAQAEPFSPYVINILDSGGIKPLIRKQLQKWENRYRGLSYEKTH